MTASTALPPGVYRADHVGSLLRPSLLKDARAKCAKGEITMEELRKVEDSMIEDVVKNQVENGLRSVTDGEFRRAFFHLDFLKGVDGVEVVEDHAGHNHHDSTNGSKDKTHANGGATAAKDGFAPPKLAVTGKLKHTHDIQVADFKFLRDTLRQNLSSITKQTSGQSSAEKLPITPKVCIPSPTMVHFRGGRASINIDAYPELEPHFFDDLARVYQEEIQALYDAGARFVQLDDTNLAYLCDEKMRKAAEERGDEPELLTKRYAELINAAISKRPQDLVIGIHLCRGNYRSQHFASGGYAPVAQTLFTNLDVDVYFLEYDDERSGDFSPLKYLPLGKFVVMGLMSSKNAESDKEEVVIGRIQEAAKELVGGLEQMCLSHQCGFSSTQEGNELTEDDQWRKIREMVNISEKVWVV